MAVARGCGKVRERLPRRARQRVQHVGVARLRVGHVVEERAELRVRQLGRDVGDLLDDRLAIERGGDDRADFAELLGVGGVFARRREEARPLGDVARDLRGADDLAALVPDRRDGQRDRQPRAVLALPNRSRSGRSSRRRGSWRGRRPLRSAAPSGISMRIDWPIASAAV